MLERSRRCESRRNQLARFLGRSTALFPEAVGPRPPMSAKLSSSDIFITETTEHGGATNVQPRAALCGAQLNMDSLGGNAPHGIVAPEAVAPTQDVGWSLSQYAWHGERLVRA